VILSGNEIGMPWGIGFIVGFGVVRFASGRRDAAPGRGRGLTSWITSASYLSYAYFFKQAV
jgi:hypothetical protein